MMKKKKNTGGNVFRKEKTVYKNSWNCENI